MSNQYMYGPYQAGNAGAEFGTYETTNYQPGKTATVVRQPISYETYEQQQPVYYDQDPSYTQQIYQQPKQTNNLYEYQTGEPITGYENYYQIQQETHQQMFPQPQTIAQQQAKMAQQKAKMVKQMVHQNQNIPNQNYQTGFASRNPNIRQQYQPQQPQIIQKKYSGRMNQQQEMYGQQYQPQQPQIIQKKYSGRMNQQQEMYGQQNEPQFDQPQIEPDFQPEIPIANSVLNQSKIPFQENQVKTTPAYNPQAQTNPSYVIPRRNPNANLKQYGYYGDSHFVNSVDPGTSTMQVNNQSMQKKNSSSIQKKISGQLSQKSSGKIQNSLATESVGQPEVGIGSTNFGKSVGMSEVQKESTIDNVGTSGMKNVEPVMQSKVNDEFEKENPIEEKFPDQSNVENLNNQNEGFPQQITQNPSQIGDIDDQLDHLPTINSIMKGNSELLPPPKKKKYK